MNVIFLLYLASKLNKVAELQEVQIKTNGWVILTLADTENWPPPTARFDHAEAQHQRILWM